MNHILRRASRVCLSKNVRSIAPSAVSFGGNGTVGIQSSGVYNMSRRFNSSNTDKPTDVPTISEMPFPSTSEPPVDVTAIGDASSALNDAIASAVVSAPPDAGFVIGHLMSGLDQLHTMAGIPYWGAIVAATIGIRILLLPVAIKTIQGSARMAIMRPDMQKVQDLMTSDPNAGEVQVKLKYQNEMKALFVKHKVNPARALLWPLFQFPIFISIFMGLKEMGQHYPDFATGGIWIFTNLAAADTSLILPIFNSLSFLAMVEMGADGIQVNQQKVFKNVMRGLAVVMVPITMDMPSGLFVYWCTNNVISLIQTQVMKNERVRVALDIPKPPAAEDTPVLKMVNPWTAVQEMIEKERAQKSNARAEILEGVAAPPGPPAKPAPVSFAMPPRQTRRPKVGVPPKV